MARTGYRGNETHLRIGAVCQRRVCRRNRAASWPRPLGYHRDGLPARDPPRTDRGREGDGQDLRVSAWTLFKPGRAVRGAGRLHGRMRTSRPSVRRGTNAPPAAGQQLCHPARHPACSPRWRASSGRVDAAAGAGVLLGLLSRTERKNGWTLAEFAGDLTLDGMQRLLNFYAWDADAVRDAVRRYVVRNLGNPATRSCAPGWSRRTSAMCWPWPATR